MVSSGTLVDNGRILLLHGGTIDFHGTFISNGAILDANTVCISNVTRSGNDLLIQIPSVAGFINGAGEGNRTLVTPILS